jgi:hypothetical protein
MRLFKGILIFSIVIAIGASGAVAAAKCEAEKKAMDNAWTEYSNASKAWEASLDQLVKALGQKEAADKAYETAVKKVQTCSTEYQQAKTDWTDCLDSGENPQCSVEERMMDRARDKLDKATDEQMKAFADCVIADTAWNDAKAKTHGLFQKMEAARDAYDKARDEYWRCLRGKKVFQ